MKRKHETLKRKRETLRNENVKRWTFCCKKTIVQPKNGMETKTRNAMKRKSETLRGFIVKNQ